MNFKLFGFVHLYFVLFLCFFQDFVVALKCNSYCHTCFEGDHGKAKKIASAENTNCTNQCPPQSNGSQDSPVPIDCNADKDRCSTFKYKK